MFDFQPGAKTPQIFLKKYLTIKLIFSIIIIEKTERKEKWNF